MGELRSHGLVLRVRDLGEADKLITVLTRDAGKITAVARGSRKTKSKFSALAEPLTLGVFLFRQGKSLYTLIQGEMVKSYTALHGDLLRLAYGQYFCELCERVLPDGEPAETVFALLLTALESLVEDPDPARVARCFELSMLDELGFRPELDGCGLCGRQAGPFRFYAAEGGLLCPDCPHPAGSFPVSAASVAVMRRFLAQGFHRLAVCAVPPAVSEEIHRAVMGVFYHALGIEQLKTLEFLRNICK